MLQIRLFGKIEKLLNIILKTIKSDYEFKFSPKITTNNIPSDLKEEKEFLEIYKKCKEFSMTRIERMFSLYKAIIYIVKNDIKGEIVECGVWRGGSMMVIAYTLLKLNDTKRKLYLYDTYEGMVEPSEFDVKQSNKMKAKDEWNKYKKTKKKWNYAPLNDVKNNLKSTHYPEENLVFIKGKVEYTIPKYKPEKISILRLDTDWYESTYHEMKYLYPKLSKNGILILDDYGHWLGARKAIDDYFRDNHLELLLNRIDKPGRIAIKVENPT